MNFSGNAWTFGVNIDTDAIIPAAYLNLSDPQELSSHCMENENPDFAEHAKPGDILVADTNFGCGSSREHAPIAIKAKGISCIIATSFARIFYRNAFNIGLPILECGEAVADIRDGHQIDVNTVSGEIINQSTGNRFQAEPIPPFMQEIINDGGLMAHIAKK